MNKGKLAFALLSAVTLLTLASCGDPVKKSDDGHVLTLTNPDGVDIHYTSSDLFDQYKGNSTGVAKFYEAISEVVIRNEMHQPNRAGQLADILEKADNKVEGVKETARSNANTNKTKYKTELESQFSSYNVEDLDELKDYFAYAFMKEKVEENFYDENKDEMLSGSADYTGYLNARLPYHVKHILVKVSDSSSNLYDGTISEQDARNIASVIKRLARRQNNETFGDIAREASEDDGSAEVFGDLGIMSKATGFVNEFKLGVYAYDALYNQNAAIVANKDKLAIPNDVQTYLTGLGLGTIPYESALKLEDVAELTKDLNGEKVNDGDSKYYPRNVYFNKYYNRHNVSIITPTNNDGTANLTFEALRGFQAVAELNDQKALVDENGKIILAVRAGTGSDESGYQGLHFIVVERSALADVVNGVDLKDYYTTEIPNTSSFPKGDDNKDLITYVNFMKTTTVTYKDRSEKLKSEIKTFDSMLESRIFEKLVASQNVTYVSADLKAAINNYIEVTRESNLLSEQRSYNENWETYVRYLEYQEWQRGRLIDEVCAADFLKANDAGDPGEYGVGGVCYVKK